MAKLVLPVQNKITYIISNDGLSITCLECGSVSYYAMDVKQRYCGQCHEYHENKKASKGSATGANKTPAKVAGAKQNDVWRN